MPSRSRQPRAPMTPRPDSSIAAARIAAAGHRCIPRMGSGETWQKRAFWTLSRLEVRLCWQDATAIRPQAVRHGNKYPQCVLGRLAMAIYRRYAFPNVQQWQLFRFMHPRRGLGRENHQFAARFARHASKTSWLWQDMRKSPFGNASREDLAREGPLSLHRPLESCTARKSCRNSALVRSYARKAGGDGSLQARFALRLTASHVCARPPPTAPYPVTKLRTSRPRTPVAATAFGELTVRRRVCLPELRSPAATFTAASFRQPCTHSNRAPMATACPGAAHLTARLASQLMLRRTDGAGVPIPRQPPNPWRVPFRNRPPHGTSCPPQPSIRAPLVGSGFPRRSAQKSDQLNAGRFGSSRIMR